MYQLESYLQIITPHLYRMLILVQSERDNFEWKSTGWHQLRADISIKIDNYHNFECLVSSGKEKS